MHRFAIVAITAVVFAGALACTTRTGGDAQPAGTTPAESTPATSYGKVVTLDDVTVGDCLKFVGADLDDVEAHTVDCADPAATYEVAAELPSPTAKCANDLYDSYVQTGRDEFTLCLMLNVTAGGCYDSFYDDDTGPRLTQDCATAVAIVTAVLDGTADESACPADTKWPQAYPEPPPGRTVCVAAR